jgi:hypothetical protein
LAGRAAFSQGTNPLSREGTELEVISFRWRR